MKTLRQVHLYLGCLFAPLIIYFCISGMWQVFRFNDVPKNEVAPLRSFLHEISKPHTHATLPYHESKTENSISFAWAAAVMGAGITVSAVLGIILAFRFSKKRGRVLLCLILGAALPILFLLLAVNREA
jgi:CDP-diglyceride synthetase